MSSSDLRNDAHEISKKILRTANYLFDKYGIESVSMHQIAKSAGIGQGTLYRRYANKGDLCMGLMKENFTAFSEDIRQYLQGQAHTPPYNRLCAVFLKLILLIAEKYRWLGEIHTHIKVDDTKNNFFHSPPYHFMHGIISGLLEEATADQSTDRIDPNITAHMLIASMSPQAIMHLRNEHGYTFEQIADNFCNAFLKTICSD